MINAITNTDHRNIYKAAVVLSPTNQPVALALEWPYDASLINTPIMLISGAGGGDDAVITLEGLTSIYDQISGNKVMARRVDTDHGSNGTVNDGYVIAWFMWQLQGNEEAAEAFIGDTPEIMGNPLYQDQQVSLQS